MRSMTLTLLAASACLMLGTTAFAQSTSSTTTTTTIATPPTATAPATSTTTTTVAVDNPDQVVCRSMDPPTGTRLGTRRICHTNQQWADIQRQDQADAQKMQMQGYRGGQPGN